MKRPGQTTIDVVTGGASVALVIPSLLPLFAGGGLGWLVAAVVFPVAVCLASALAPSAKIGSAGLRSRIGDPWARLASDVVGSVVILAAMPADAQGRGALAGLASGATRLVTAALPVAPSGPELGVVAVIVVITSGIGAELALRRRSPLLPAVPVLVLYAAALAVGAGGLRAPRWDAVLLVGGLGVAALARRAAALIGGGVQGAGAPVVVGARVERAPVPWRRLGAGVALTGIASAVALPLGVSLPGGSAQSRFDLRGELRPAVGSPPGLNPLVTYASIYDGPVTPEVTVRSSSVVGGLYWRLDTLDHFTGTGWVSTQPLLPGGTTLPPGARLGVATYPVDATVTMHQASVFLPAPDRPSSISVAGLDVSPADGVLAVPAGRKTPTSYVVRSEIPDPSRDQLISATGPPRTASSDPTGAEPTASVTSTATGLIAHVPATAFARLNAISGFLTGAGFVRHLPGGSPINAGNYGVAQLLTSHDGSAAQYAAAFALLARSIGLDARLAVGYQGGTTDPTTGDVTFTSRDLTVWPEVLLAGIGWYPWPTVPATGAGLPARAAASPSSTLRAAMQQQQAMNNAGTPGPAPAAPPARRPARTGRGGISPIIVVVPLVVGLVLLGLVALLVVKAVRRRRQEGAGDAGRRVDGAWECVLDRLAERGVDVDAALTVPEIVRRAERDLGAERIGPLHDLVDVVDARRYNRQVAPSAAAADLAWKRTTDVERSLRTGTSTSVRVRAALSPAPWRRP